ncbi:MAG: hypothetical protein MUE85_12735 [Microscillaceae bacterium]|jgi:hydrogenase maturation factor|nr:hypothetical protein [Microscillaceae bacterium]
MQAIYQNALQQWKDYVTGNHNPQVLSDLLADEVIFHSPVVWTPQVGKAVTTLYLLGAAQVLQTDFHYTRQIIDAEGRNWCLEFECKVDDITVKGVDLIQLNETGKIIDFEVMVRPLKAIQAVHTAMGAMLEQLKNRK